MKTDIQKHIRKRSTELFLKVKQYREYLHQHPELSYQEYETMAYVSKILEDLGISHQTGVGDTGVVAIIRGEQHTEFQACIALRADLDALPIQELNQVEYKSKRDGVMHACGHDVHTAILLGTAELLQEIRHELPNPVKLIFQPGEEKNPGGASLMIRDGVLKNPSVKSIYALHVFPDLVAGYVGFKSGLYMASCDEIYLTIIGKGGHAATPHACIDPILIASNVVIRLQEIVSRMCDPQVPSVLSIGHFEAIGATNIIPERALLKGTFRTMNENWRVRAHELIRRIIEETCKASGGSYELVIDRGYPFLENDPTITSILKEKSVKFFGEDKVVDLPIRLTSEDFSFYAQEVPACFFRLGVRNEKDGIIHNVHHPKFDIDNTALITGIQLMSIAALD